MAREPLDLETLAEVIRTCAGVTVDPDRLAAAPLTSFADLDVDSLGVLGVVADLERRFEVSLGSEAQECQTPTELLRMVNDQIRTGA